jgi:hypothetical protein
MEQLHAKAALNADKGREIDFIFLTDIAVPGLLHVIFSSYRQ